MTFKQLMQEDYSYRQYEYFKSGLAVQCKIPIQLTRIDNTDGTTLFVFLLVGCTPEEPDEAKPVIYLYPESKQEIEVKLDYAGELTCTYPEYKNGWDVVAYPDGTLVDNATGEEYSYLFWEGNSDTEYDLSKGYVIAGEDTAKFLEEKLAELGLNRTEANEFIVYWLPKMQSNLYNLITFQNDIYTNLAKLEINDPPGAAGQLRRLVVQL